VYQFKARGITTVYLLAHGTLAAMQAFTANHRLYYVNKNHVKSLTVVLTIAMSPLTVCEDARISS
jgi:hypothetical protein